jgi:hypothetical protein
VAGVEGGGRWPGGGGMEVARWRRGDMSVFFVISLPRLKWIFFHWILFSSPPIGFQMDIIKKQVLHSSPFSFFSAVCILAVWVSRL